MADVAASILAKLKNKQESLINAKDLQVTVIKEPDAKTQSR